MNLNINLEELKEKKELVSIILLGSAAILAVLTCIWVTKYLLLSTKTENIILNAIKQSQRPQTEVEQVLADTQNLVASLRTNNLFAPPVIETPITEERVIAVNPINEITAILGNSAYINSSWYKAGDEVRGSGGNAKIIAIGLDSVTVEFNGMTEILKPINATTRASEISSTNPMASMMGGGISFSNGNITISTSAASDILTRLTGRGGMMGGMMGGDMMGGGMMGGGMMGGGGGRGGRGGGMGGGGRGGRGGGGGFGGF